MDKKQEKQVEGRVVMFMPICEKCGADMKYEGFDRYVFSFGSYYSYKCPECNIEFRSILKYPKLRFVYGEANESGEVVEKYILLEQEDVLKNLFS